MVHLPKKILRETNSCGLVKVWFLVGRWECVNFVTSRYIIGKWFTYNARNAYVVRLLFKGGGVNAD